MEPCSKSKKAKTLNLVGVLGARWANIMGRCYNPANKDYDDYGGRGITTCERWRNKEYFNADILLLLGPPAKGMTLDRADNNSGYRPDNVRWATHQQQAENKRTYSNNKSGAVGVRKRGRRWLAQATCGGKVYHIGSYRTMEDAVTARANYLLLRKTAMP